MRFVPRVDLRELRPLAKLSGVMQLRPHLWIPDLDLGAWRSIFDLLELDRQWPWPIDEGKYEKRKRVRRCLAHHFNKITKKREMIPPAHSLG